MADTLASIINVIAQLFTLLILGRAILSWVQADRYHPVVKFLHDVTEPLLAPIRNILPQGSMIDFSPMIAILLIDFLLAPVLVYVVRALF